jgi:hypothetical protein
MVHTLFNLGVLQVVPEKPNLDISHANFGWFDPRMDNGGGWGKQLYQYPEFAAMFVSLKALNNSFKL